MTSNGSGGFVGFNPTVIQENLGKCNRTAEKICSGISDEFSEIIIAMERNWAAPEAVIYSNELVAKMNTITEEAYRVVTNVLDSIVDAYNKWCNSTGYQFPLLSKSSLYSKYRPLESFVRPDANGIVGIDIDYFSQTFKNVNTDNVDARLNEFRMSIERLSFIGGNQQKVLEDSVIAICNKFQRSLTEFKSEIVDEMNRIVQKYQDTSGNVNREFESMGFFVAE